MRKVSIGKRYLEILTASFIFVAMPSLNRDIPGLQIPDRQRLRLERPASLNTYEDSGYTTEKTEFLTNEKVYIKATLPDFSFDKVTLSLLDSNNQLMYKINFNLDGTVLTSSIDAPNSLGIYYLDLEGKGEGTSLTSKRNITVKGEGSVKTVLGDEVESSQEVGESINSQENTTNEIQTKTKKYFHTMSENSPKEIIKRHIFSWLGANLLNILKRIVNTS